MGVLEFCSFGLLELWSLEFGHGGVPGMGIRRVAGSTMEKLDGHSLTHRPHLHATSLPHHRHFPNTLTHISLPFR